jgi:hypothetical protein
MPVCRLSPHFQKKELRPPCLREQRRQTTSPPTRSRAKLHVINEELRALEKKAAEQHRDDPHNMIARLRIEAAALENELGNSRVRGEQQEQAHRMRDDLDKLGPEVAATTVSKSTMACSSSWLILTEKKSSGGGCARRRGHAIS